MEWDREGDGEGDGEGVGDEWPGQAACEFLARA